MLKRFRFLARYATVQQLQVALALDASLLVLVSTIAGVLVARRHPFIAVPFLLGSLVEGVCTGVGIFLILHRRVRRARFV